VTGFGVALDLNCLVSRDHRLSVRSEPGEQQKFNKTFLTEYMTRVLYEFDSIPLITQRKMTVIIILLIFSSKYKCSHILNEIFFTDQVDLVVMLLTCVWNALDSELGQDTGQTYWFSRALLSP
jgi:hypothetical protein